jgi:hypothetical protein
MPPALHPESGVAPGIDIGGAVPEALELWGSILDKQVESRKGKGISLEESVAGAWKLWDKRLKLFLLRGQQDFDPEWADLVCAVADVPPTDLALEPLGKLGLGAWSGMVRRITGLDPVSKDEPLWLRVAALARLGLGAGEDLFMEPSTGEGWEDPQLAEYEDWREWVGRAVPARTRAQALLLRTEERSLSKEWPVSDVYGCLALQRSTDLDLLLSLGGNRFFANPQAPPRLLLVEARDGKEMDQGRYAAKLLGADEGPEGPRTVYLVPEGFTAKTRELPIVVAPRNLDDAIERGFERLSPPVP